MQECACLTSYWWHLLRVTTHEAMTAESWEYAALKVRCYSDSVQYRVVRVGR